MKTKLDFITHKIEETGTVVLRIQLELPNQMVYSQSRQMSIQEYNRLKDWSYALRDVWAKMVENVTYQMIVEEGLPNEDKQLK